MARTVHELVARTAPETTVLAELTECQSSLHRWGAANQVMFDAGKEEYAVLSQSDPEGETFKLLGVEFDPKLNMEAAIHTCVSACSWKLKTVLRARRFFSDAELITVLKAHIISFVEYRPPHSPAPA